MKNLSTIRQEKKISQFELAKILNVSRSSIAMWETGKSQPGYETLIQLSNFFNCSIDYLLGKSDEPKTIDEQLDGISFALNSETKELTDEQKQDVLNFVRFIKSQNKGNE